MKTERKVMMSCNANAVGDRHRSLLQTFGFEKFLGALRQGILKVDFDARTEYNRPGHNHGTKFRIPANLFPTFYEHVTTLLDAPLDRRERLKRIDITEIRSIEEIENAARDGPTLVQLYAYEGNRVQKRPLKVAEQPELDMEY